jgi:hypothetical protein
LVTYNEVYLGELRVWRGEHALFGCGCHVCLMCMGREGGDMCFQMRVLTRCGRSGLCEVFSCGSLVVCPEHRLEPGNRSSISAWRFLPQRDIVCISHSLQHLRKYLCTSEYQLSPCHFYALVLKALAHERTRCPLRYFPSTIEANMLLS